jgi:hypothetical protein
MAHSLVMAGEICSVRQHGNQSERNLRRPCSCLTPHYSQRKTVPEKALTISGADRFTRRGGTCRLHAIFMNQLCIIWGEREELSSTAARAACSPRLSVSSSRFAADKVQHCYEMKPYRPENLAMHQSLSKYRIKPFRCPYARARLGGTMLLDLLEPPGRCSGCWPHAGEVAGGAVASSF